MSVFDTWVLSSLSALNLTVSEYFKNEDAASSQTYYRIVLSRLFFESFPAPVLIVDPLLLSIFLPLPSLSSLQLEALVWRERMIRREPHLQNQHKPGNLRVFQKDLMVRQDFLLY